MSLRTLLILSSITLFLGCSGDQVKNDELPEVTDLGSGTSVGTNNKPGEEENKAKTYGVDGHTPSMSSLDDPKNPLLSTRVIYFKYDSDEISSEYRPVIMAHATYLAQSPNTTITLEGHADERGSREYNLALGERRALSIKQQLLLLGVLSSQIRLVSYGEERPVTNEHGETAWQQNRRVEILY